MNLKMNEVKRCAEILVKCGYIRGFWCDGKFCFYDKRFKKESDIDPFADTLEGRRQLDVIFNHFHKGDVRQSMIDTVKRLAGKQEEMT